MVLKQLMDWLKLNFDTFGGSTHFIIFFLSLRFHFPINQTPQKTFLKFKRIVKYTNKFEHRIYIQIVTKTNTQILIQTTQKLKNKNKNKNPYNVRKSDININVLIITRAISSLTAIKLSKLPHHLEEKKRKRKRKNTLRTLNYI